MSEGGSDGRNSDWPQLVVEVTSGHLEEVEEWFHNHSAIAITRSDAQDAPILEPLPGEVLSWPITRLTVLFAKETDLRSLTGQFSDDYPLLANAASVPLTERVWSRTWLDHFQPTRFGSRLWVCPDSREPRGENQVVVRLDPGLAFGTGSHPTTALCLRWLDRHPPLNQLVIDYGCGSGVLALAAAKLGATAVTCVDIDPQALEATTENAVRNNETEKIRCLPAEQALTSECHLLMANILAGPLLSLKPVFSELLGTGHSLLLSGILTTQTEQIVDHYETHFEQFLITELDGWAAISAIRKSD